ncbi:Acetophenone carboxylase delta subunit [Paraburkholderia domus]|uniref:hydantoinase B/oxoprolinase family protein n=1 Tax=Paraburkholderia domus TaxID=2793075 RepID=UPI001914A84A|nr:hydantoinase B/oxoprolinase family protein [Paraburkholderia domus]MBK5091414.1 hydantoinase B/oxoprolinase family protein [Burkholderia sp. R-69927]CAE6935934.1 Acetophenone carboxylase delta subunit [Paraburkholderia domus]
MTTRVDAITQSVIQHRLAAIAEEMGEAMLRTTYSQILNASRDFSIGILDRQARLISQADHIPIHVGALKWAVKAVEERFGDDIAAGDVILLNDPYHGGSHLPDLTAFVPVFAGEHRCFWAVVRGHMGDIGGATHGAYNPHATEIWQEGLRIPPMKIVDAGRTREDVMDMILLNVRLPRDFRGDLAAMIGAAHFGERSMLGLLEQYGAEIVDQAVDNILDSAERRAREIVASWPDGEYVGEAFLDDDGHGRENIAIRARVTKTGSALHVDLTESDPQSRGFANSSYANTEAAIAMAFAYLIDADIPKNDGTFRLITTALKPGTVVCANNNAAVTLSTTHPSNEIVEAIVRALAPACPTRAMGGWSRRFRISIKGDNPRTGKPFIWHMFHARPGGGASPAGDGWSAAGEWHSVGGIKFGSIEVTEARFPLFFERHEFRPASGGDGKYRGGMGSTMHLRVEVPAIAHTAGEGTRHGSAGILGGEDGKPHDYTLIGKGEQRKLRTKEFGIAIEAGDLLDVRSAGGGGWSSPSERDAAARRRDARDELA